MATNKERTSSAAMRKLLLQSASKKEQEIQQIGSVAESTIPQPAIEHPIQSLRKKILGISGRAKIKEHRSNPDIQRNPQKAEADCYGHWIRNAQHRKQHS